MLESFIYSFNSVSPIFLLVLFGMLLKKIGFLKDDFCKIADKLVFNVALPFELFKSVSQTEFEKIFSAENIEVITFFVIGIVASFVLLCLIIPVFVKDRAKCSSFIQGAFRGNFVIFALPLATNMFGEAGKIAATPLLPVVTIMFNALAVVVFCIFAPKDQTKKSAVDIVKQIAFSIIKNPLIIAILIGFGFSLIKTYLNLTIPQFVLKPIGDVASCAVP